MLNWLFGGDPKAHPKEERVREFPAKAQSDGFADDPTVSTTDEKPDWTIRFPLPEGDEVPELPEVEDRPYSSQDVYRHHRHQVRFFRIRERRGDDEE